MPLRDRERFASPSRSARERTSAHVEATVDRRELEVGLRVAPVPGGFEVDTLLLTLSPWVDDAERHRERRRIEDAVEAAISAELQLALREALGAEGLDARQEWPLLRVVRR
jgi:hypothetical protein